MPYYKTKQSAFTVSYSDKCSKYIAKKIYNALLVLEPDYANTDKCARILSSNIKGNYLIYCEPYQYFYSHGKLVKDLLIEKLNATNRGL